MPRCIGHVNVPDEGRTGKRKMFQDRRSLVAILRLTLTVINKVKDWIYMMYKYICI